MLPWLVVGSAACVATDLATWGDRPAQVVAVNRQISDYPGVIAAGASLHQELVPEWRASRTQAEPWALHLHEPADGADVVTPLPDGWHGTSALYAVAVAMSLGAERVILVGCPIDDAPHYYPGPTLYNAPPLAPWLAYYRRGWRTAYPTIAGLVTSLSGWTRDLLGEPDEEWLACQL